MLFSLTMLGLTIASFHLTRNISSEVEKLVLALIGSSCLIAFLVSTPWMVQLLIIVVLLTVPICYREPANSQSSCSRFCLSRSRCSTYK